MSLSSPLGGSQRGGDNRGSISGESRAISRDQNSVGEGDNSKISSVAKKGLENLSDLKIPRVKKVGFSFENLNRGPGFTGLCKSIWRFFSRVNQNVYSGLRGCVTKFNKSKTDEDLKGVLQQIAILKRQDNPDWNDRDLKEIGIQVALARLMSEEIQVHSSTLNVTCLGKEFDKLNDKIKAFNGEKKKQNFQIILAELQDLRSSNDPLLSRHTNEIEMLLYELSRYVQNESLFKVFSLLRTDKTLEAHRKIQELEKKIGEGVNVFNSMELKGEILDIPQINISLSWSKRLRGLSSAIATFNRDKTSVNFNAVLEALKEYQHSHNDRFKGSNGLKIVAKMKDILEKKTK
ncbi:MAG: hypothetical protein JSS09_09470, partial [Verrucomicrobia bacterium]|nr:hypothetical protein [Verrucomicrobiota bacterium]